MTEGGAHGALPEIHKTRLDPHGISSDDLAEQECPQLG